MDTRYPPEVVALLESIKQTRRRLRREIEQSKQLLAEIKERMQADERTWPPFSPSYLRQR